MAKVFDEHEFAARRQSLKERGKKLESERQELQAKIVTREKIEATKARVLAICNEMKPENPEIDPPFEIKKTILKLIVDKIRINTREGWFELEGAFRGRYSIRDSIAYTHADMGSRRRPT